MLTILFVIFLLASVALRLWLASRQIRHVLAHRDQVPGEFASRIGLESHQRAADYTTARVRLGIFEGVFDAAVVVALTLLGGLQAIDTFVATLTTHDLFRQVLLVVDAALSPGWRFEYSQFNSIPSTRAAMQHLKDFSEVVADEFAPPVASIPNSLSQIAIQ